MHAAWRGAAQWRILQTGFGAGAQFLHAWAAWRAEPERPRLLHFIATMPAPFALGENAAPADLAEQLRSACWGLLPGVHRLGFEQGRVLLTLYIGDAEALLRQQAPTVDAVLLTDPAAAPLKTIARCCQRGTGLTSDAPLDMPMLAECGFVLDEDGRAATFNPAWQPRTSAPVTPAAQPTRCLVIGAGLAGAGAAASLARRGWQVQVIDQGAAPAAGASGLPAGLFAPHVSPDDSVLSRLSRAGVRLMREHCATLLREGVDWAPSGVLERRLEGKKGLPQDWQGHDWSQPASPAHLHAAHLPAHDHALWHPRAAWLRPARLVAALLAQPGIAFQGHCAVARIVRHGSDWQALDAHGAVLAQAPHCVIAAGPASLALARTAWPLRPVRGQLSQGMVPPDGTLPPFPVNGKGALICTPEDAGAQWHAGSTFERGETALPPPPADQAAAQADNAQRMATLLPHAAPQLDFAERPPWSAVRATLPDRLPAVGPVDAARTGLWVSTAMGARGLTLALLCGELLAARLHGEPLPIEAKLAQALDSARL